jgi:apolipoprotein D and lipocalin family protein
MTRVFRRYPIIFFLSLLLSGCSLGPPPGVVPVSGFELPRYLGHWYEIARLDHSFERGMTDVSARYQMHDDNSVEVINRGYEPANGRWREATGTARFIGEPTRGSLKVSFFGPFYGGYHIAALDPDYRWSLVIGPDTGYAWILARDKTLPAGIREQLVKQAAAAGIDTDALIWVEHTK